MNMRKHSLLGAVLAFALAAPVFSSCNLKDVLDDLLNAGTSVTVDESLVKDLPLPINYEVTFVNKSSGKKILVTTSVTAAGFKVASTKDLATGNYQVTVKGEAGEGTVNPVTYAYSATVENLVVTASSLSISPQVTAKVIWKDDDYQVVRLKDGRYWFAENLRYLPDGITPCSSLNNVTGSIYYPLKVNDAKDGLAFDSSEEGIRAKGYLYQAEVALGHNIGFFTTEALARAAEGVQGLCPTGWHVPTVNEIVALVGKAVSPIETKTDAPYYDGANGSVALLNADGFNMSPVGAVSIQDITKTSGTFMGVLYGDPKQISSGMFCGSTCSGVTYNTSGDPDSGIKNIQFYGFMPMTNKPEESQFTCNGTKVSYRIAAPVRCIRTESVL